MNTSKMQVGPYRGDATWSYDDAKLLQEAYAAA